MSVGVSPAFHPDHQQASRITVEALGFQPSEIACVTKGGFSPGTRCPLWKILSSPISNPIPAKSNIPQEI